MLNIDTITKIFNTGFTRQTPNPTNTEQITWNSLGTANLNSLNKINNLITPTEIKQEYINIIEKMLASRADYYKTIDAIAYSDKTLEIVDQLIDEILNAVNAQEPFTPAILESEPNAELALEACRELNHNCHIYRYDRDLLKKLIIYGEYFISTEITVGKGITKINDMIEAQNILPLYDGYDLKEYIGLLKDFSGQTNISQVSWNESQVRIDRNLLTHFAVSPNRFPLKDENLKELINKGYSTLVGVSSLYPALSRLYKLSQLDTAADIQALDQISKPQLIGVPISSNVKPTDYPEIARTYTNFLQPILGNGTNKDINSILNSLKTGGGFQVLPFPQGQGTPEAITFQQQDLTTLNDRIAKLSEAIDKSLGLDDSNSNNRSQIYAIKSRLVKRLQDVLEARRLGWKEIYLRHLLFKGIYVDPMNFDVQMAALPDYDIFAEAEGISHLIEAMRDAFGFATDVQNMGLFESLDASCLQNLFDSYVGTRYPTLKGLFGNAINTIETTEDLDDDEYNDMMKSSGGGHPEFRETTIEETPIEETPVEETSNEEIPVEETPQVEVEETTTEE